MDCYDVPRCNTYTDAEMNKGSPEDQQEDQQDGGDDYGRQYARVASIVANEVPVQDNNAYGYTISTKSDPTLEQQIYAVPHCDKQETNTKQNDGTKRSKQCCAALSITAVLFVAILALAEASLGLFLILNGYQPCIHRSCNSRTIIDNNSNSDRHSHNHSNFDSLRMLAQLQSQLRETDKKLSALENAVMDHKINQLQIDQTLDSKITNYSSIINSYIEANTVNHSENAGSAPIPQKLHNCSTSVEASCTVEVDVGQCLTPRVAVSHPNSVLMSSDCVRMDSNEQNPLVGVVDFTDGLLECLCYVIEINGIRRRNPTQCSLLVTRCQTTI